MSTCCRVTGDDARGDGRDARAPLSAESCLSARHCAAGRRAGAVAWAASAYVD